jgi:hypothetical protein
MPVLWILAAQKRKNSLSFQICKCFLNLKNSQQDQCCCCKFNDRIDRGRLLYDFFRGKSKSCGIFLGSMIIHRTKIHRTNIHQTKIHRKLIHRTEIHQMYRFIERILIEYIDLSKEDSSKAKIYRNSKLPAIPLLSNSGPIFWSRLFYFRPIFGVKIGVNDY